MSASEKFMEYLKENPKASVQVTEGNCTKAMVFDGAIVVQTSDVTFVRIGDEIFETDVSFYDKVLSVLQQIPLKS